MKATQILRNLEVPVMESPYTHIADLYDTFVQTEVDIPFFIEEAHNTTGELLELMAGTGRVTLPLVEAGISVTCIDNVPEMLAILNEKLQRRGLSTDVRLMDVRHFALDKQFSLIIIPFHAFPEITDAAEQLQTLTKIKQHLAADGRFICTLHNPKVRLRSVDGQLRLIANKTAPNNSGNRLLVWLQQSYDPTSKLVTAMEFFEEYDEKAVLINKRFAEIRFHMLEKATFEQLIHQAGFQVEQLYGNYSRAPFDEEQSPFMIWLLKHRST